MSTEWLEPLIEKARLEIRATEDPTMRDIGSKALNMLENRQDDVLALGKDGLTSFVAEIGRGKTLAAQDKYIQAHAQADELIAGVEQAAVNIAEASRQQQERTEKAMAFVRDLGFMGARYLLTLLI